MSKYFMLKSMGLMFSLLPNNYLSITISCIDNYSLLNLNVKTSPHPLGVIITLKKES